jgi:transcriptional regulator with XRE-family HTH domain
MEPAQVIARTRRQVGWTTRRLARETGLSPGYISLLENGKRPVTPEVLGRIAAGLQRPPHELLAEAGFISAEHYETARNTARTGLGIPSIATSAAGTTMVAKYHTLVVDYLCRLGEDPFGVGWDPTASGRDIDWGPLDPDLTGGAPTQTGLAQRDPSGPRSGQSKPTRVIDWGPPDRHAPQPAPTRAELEIAGWNEGRPPAPEPVAIEGWRDLPDSDRALVQQLVNRLRHRSSAPKAEVETRPYGKED